MREVESERKKRPLIADRSCQQKTGESDRNPLQMEGKPHSHEHLKQCSLWQLIAAVFEFKSRDFDGFNVGFNILNNELKKSGLNNNEYGGLHAAPEIDTNDKICPIGVELHDFDNVGCIFNYYGNIDDNGLQYDVSFGMEILFSFFVFYFCSCH